MVNGLVYPWLTIGLLSTYFVGRKAFTYGYQEKEGAFNQVRVGGSIACNLVHFVTMGASLFLSYRMIAGKLCL